MLGKHDRLLWALSIHDFSTSPRKERGAADDIDMLAWSSVRFIRKSKITYELRAIQWEKVNNNHHQ